MCMYSSAEYYQKRVTSNHESPAFHLVLSKIISTRRHQRLSLAMAAPSPSPAIALALLRIVCSFPIHFAKEDHVCAWTEPTPSSPCGAHGTAGRPISPYTPASAEVLHTYHVVANQHALKLVLGRPAKCIAGRMQVLCSPCAHCTRSQPRPPVVP